MVTVVVDEQVAPLQCTRGTILVVDVECFFRVLLVVTNPGYRRIPTDDRLVVGGPCESLCHGQHAPSVVDRHLVPDRRLAFLASVRTGLVVGAPTPRDMGYISGTHRARKPQLLVLSHNVVQLAVLVRREVDVLVVHLRREVLAEFVERRLHYRAAHPRKHVDASETVPPGEYGQAGQHLQHQSQHVFMGGVQIRS